jgi:hypothetical protein
MEGGPDEAGGGLIAAISPQLKIKGKVMVNGESWRINTYTVNECNRLPLPISIVSQNGSKINAEPFLPFLLLVFLVVEAVQFARAVGDVSLEFAGIFEQFHRKEFLPEVTPIEFDIEDGFIEVLQFPEGKLLWEEAEAQWVLLDTFLKPDVADVEDFPVVEGHFGEGGHAMPVQFIGEDLQLMVFNIDQ